MKLKKLDLTDGPILQKLIKLTMPLMATALIQMTYNFTDMIWVGKLGKDAVAAVGVSSFFVWIAGEFAIISKVGTSVKVAMAIGSKQESKQLNLIKTGFFLILSTALFYAIFIQLFSKQLVGFYQLELSVSKMAASYLSVVGIGFIFHFINFWLSSLYHSMGDSVTPFKYNSIGLIINVILDPILIFTVQLGVVGAAIATTLAQFVVTLWFIWDILTKHNLIYNGFKQGQFHHQEMSEIIKVGLPAGVQGIAHASISTILSKFMSQFGADPIAVFSIGTMVESITWMTTEGFQTAVVAFVGQNYGANQYIRLRSIIKTAMKTVASIGVISTLILTVFRYPIFRIFLNSPKSIVDMGALYLLILGFSQFFMAIEIGGAGVFNGLGLTKIPSTISLIFNLCRIPLSLLLMPTFAYAGVWMAMSISSFFKGIFVNLLLYKTVKEKLC